MEYHRKDEVLIQAIQSNWLVNRWFGKDYQGNLYAFGGLGIAQDRSPLDKSSEITLFTGLMADWETRSKFLSYQFRKLDLGSLGHSTMHAARLGWAPYEGKTGDLHTWLMLEIDHRSELSESISVTPLLRFFRGPILLELGYNVTDASPLLNFTVRL